MKKYYYHDGKDQQGPFTFDELKEKKLTKETMIWFEGIQSWQKASEIDELKALFIEKPPPLKPPILENTQTDKELKKQTVEKSPKKRKNKKGLIIIISVIAVIAFLAITFNIFDSGGGYTPETEYEMEQNHPEWYLNASGTYNENFWGTKVTINGYVENKATYTDYKDVRIKITFYTKTETAIESEEYIIYDYFPAGSKKEFSMKIKFPDGAKKVWLGSY